MGDAGDAEIQGERASPDLPVETQQLQHRPWRHLPRLRPAQTFNLPLQTRDHHVVLFDRVRERRGEPLTLLGVLEERGPLQFVDALALLAQLAQERLELGSKGRRLLLIVAYSVSHRRRLLAKAFITPKSATALGQHHSRTPTTRGRAGLQADDLAQWSRRRLASNGTRPVGQQAMGRLLELCELRRAWEPVIQASRPAGRLRWKRTI